MQSIHLTAGMLLMCLAGTPAVHAQGTTTDAQQKSTAAAGNDGQDADQTKPGVYKSGPGGIKTSRGPAIGGGSGGPASPGNAGAAGSGSGAGAAGGAGAGGAGAGAGGAGAGGAGGAGGGGGGAGGK